MTALDAPAAGGFVWGARDALTVTGRNLRRLRREPEVLFFAAIQPVIFVLLFRYVFGGAIDTPGLRYVDFLMPGIFVQTTAFASTATGVALADDLTKGIVDRFRAMPIARSAVLAGRTLSDVLRMVFTVAVMVVVGVLVGLRFHEGLVKAACALLLVIFFGFAFTWISAWIGLMVKTVEAANLAGFVWLFPLTFASSAFAPVETMPGWLQAFTAVTPVTPTVDAVRALINGGPTARPLITSICWLIAIVAVFSTLAVRRYRRIA